MLRRALSLRTSENNTAIPLLYWLHSLNQRSQVPCERLKIIRLHSSELDIVSLLDPSSANNTIQIILMKH